MQSLTPPPHFCTWVGLEGALAQQPVRAAHQRLPPELSEPLGG
jgi:hypothetical protein